MIEALRLGLAGAIVGEELVDRSRYVVRRLSIRKVQAMAALINSSNSKVAAEGLGISHASLRRLTCDVQAVVGVQLLSEGSQHASVHSCRNPSCDQLQPRLARARGWISRPAGSQRRG